jgi:hypothetical protein
MIPQGQPVSLGSGFFIADGVIATNAHVIDGASNGTAKLIGKDQHFKIIGTLAVDHHTDLALLKIETIAPILHCSTNAIPQVGDKVYVVGNPLGLEGTFSEGIISAIRKVQTDFVLQMTAPISPGSSGGPVMDSIGNVVGVSEATYRDGQNLNIAVPVEYLSKLLASISLKETITPLSQQSNIGKGPSVIDGIGTRIEAGVNINNFKLIYHKYAGYKPDTGGFEFRISNKLPVSITQIKLRIIYRDESNSIMDFEDYTYQFMIPPGLTKTDNSENSAVALRAAQYYDARDVDGNLLPPPRGDNFYNSQIRRMEPKVEIRIIKFITEESE